MRGCLSLLFVVVFTLSLTAQPTNQFVTVNSVKLHYVDWGGSGDTLLFLTSFGANAREFDRLAPKFVARHHVLGLTRRAQWHKIFDP